MNEEQLCQPCEVPITDKVPPCPLQCKSPKCKSYKEKTCIDSSKTPIVWILGGPGSGKRTQCDKIIAEYGFIHLSPGELLRDEVLCDSPRAKCLSAIMLRGELVPNDLVLDILKEAMLEHAEKARGFLIDGYPREKSQGIAFEQTIAPASVIIYFEAKFETLEKRLLDRAVVSGRADDNAETIKLKLKVFFDNNAQVVAQYSDKLRRINAEQPIDAIYGEIQKILDPIVAGVAATRH